MNEENIENNDLEVRTNQNSINNDFGKMGICQSLLKIIEEQKFKAPTSVQYKSIPFALAGDDLIVNAATGSGKTLIYAVSLIEKVIPGNGVQGMVIVPTRELAIQVGKVLKVFSKGFGLNIMTSYGGGSLKEQKQLLADVDILVGTPGRISDYVEQDLFQLGHIKILVLDEVDSMMQEHFQKELNYILETTPKNKQTQVFSATISKEIYLIIKKYMNDPKRITAEKLVSAKKLTQTFYEIEPKQKLSLLSYLLENEKAGLSIVFTNRQDTAEFIFKNLRHLGLDIGLIHGDLSQGKRNRILNDFKSEKLDVLISTDIAARGIDAQYVTHIYNYNIPKYDEKYIHRIGRTARAGESGKVINFISKNEVELFHEIIRNHKISLKKKDLPNFPELKIKKEFVKKKPRR